LFDVILLSNFFQQFTERENAMKINKLFLFACIFCLAITASAQKMLEKPYQKWSKEDALKLLNESPWAQSYQSAEAAAAAAQAQSAQEQNDQRILNRNPTGRTTRNLGAQPVSIKLQSGLPVRQAMVRLQQIEAGYDKWDDEKRSKFDASAKDFLACNVCQNYYVITITKFLKASGQGVDDGMFQTLKVEDVKGKVKLINDKGVERELAQFVPARKAGESAVLFFKRMDDNGVPFLSPENKDFALVFTTDFLNPNTNPYGGLLPRRMEFKVSKLMVGEQIAF
jgi:hypothetical protein